MTVFDVILISELCKVIDSKSIEILEIWAFLILSYTYYDGKVTVIFASF